jgi:hypothetical protein
MYKAAWAIASVETLGTRPTASCNNQQELALFRGGPSTLIGLLVPHRRSWSAHTIAAGNEIHCRHLGGP